MAVAKTKGLAFNSITSNMSGFHNGGLIATSTSTKAQGSFSLSQAFQPARTCSTWFTLPARAFQA